MPIPLAKQLQAVLWIDKNVKPLIASLASKGNMDGVEAMDILAGIEGVVAQTRISEARAARGWDDRKIDATIAFVEKHGDAIRRAAG